MNLQNLYASTRRGVKQNSPLILSVAAAAGTLVTAYLTARASFKAAEMIREEESKGGTAGDPKQRLKERTKLVWKLYIPPVLSGTSTIACIVGSNRVASGKLMAANAAYAVAERTFAEYRDKVIEQHGANKEQAIRDQIAEDKVKATAPSSEVLLVGSGHILCCELHTMRYFQADTTILLKACNTINAKVNSHGYATLSDFYYEVGLEVTSDSSNLGWKDSRLLELERSSALTPAGEPCLTFTYNYLAIL